MKQPAQTTPKPTKANIRRRQKCRRTSTARTMNKVSRISFFSAHFRVSSWSVVLYVRSRVCTCSQQPHSNRVRAKYLSFVDNVWWSGARHLTVISWRIICVGDRFSNSNWSDVNFDGACLSHETCPLRFSLIFFFVPFHRLCGTVVF